LHTETWAASHVDVSAGPAQVPKGVPDATSSPYPRTAGGPHRVEDGMTMVVVTYETRFTRTQRFPHRVLDT
jgi:hypothetical protein